MTADDTTRRVANAVRTVLDAHAYVLDGVCACGRDLGAKHGQYRAALRAHTTDEIARALAEAGLLAPVLLREEAPVDEPEEWRCPGCNSDQWVRASLTRGFTVITQCVPCGRYVNCPPPDRAEGDGSAEQ